MFQRFPSLRCQTKYAVLQHMSWTLASNFNHIGPWAFIFFQLCSDQRYNERQPVHRRRRNTSPRKEKSEKTAAGVGVGIPSLAWDLKVAEKFMEVLQCATTREYKPHDGKIQACKKKEKARGNKRMLDKTKSKQTERNNEIAKQETHIQATNTTRLMTE